MSNKMTRKKEQQSLVRSVWMVSREYDGLAGAGGVKDVCRQLAETLVVEAALTVTVILPRYGFMDAGKLGFAPLRLAGGRQVEICGERQLGECSVDMHFPDRERRETISFWEQRRRGVRLLLVDAERFTEKLGVYTYTAEEEKKHAWQRRGSGHYDYFAMNILLQKAALDVMMLLDERPDVIHCHDGHAATLAAMMRENSGYRHYFRGSGVVVTIHNAGLGYHQDVGDLPFARAVTGLPELVIAAGLLGRSFDPFVAAARYAVMNTVSENYARELQETKDDARTGWLGHRLLKMGVRLAGVTNGINPRDFNPEEPEKLNLAAPFSPIQGDFEGKQLCKEDMLVACSRKTKWTRVEQVGRLIPDSRLPLLTFIGRLTTQKGVDMLLRSLLLLPAGDARFQLLVLGSGDPLLEEEFSKLAGQRDDRYRLCYLKGYDPDLAVRIYAAGDFFLIPSLYEPCGLTDYIAQLFGNLPVVHLVGGLVKVEDGKNGFGYREHSPEALAGTMQRALSVYRKKPDQIRIMQKTAVRRIYSHHTWKQVMDGYLALYDQALAMTCGS